MVDPISPALSGLSALGKKLEVTANNIANVNTNGFKKSRAILEDTSPSGVKVSIDKVETPGSPLFEEGTEKPEESSNVSVDEEMINLITTRHAYTANLKSIKTMDEILGSIIDILAR